jgi:hypothetical protein
MARIGETFKRIINLSSVACVVALVIAFIVCEATQYRFGKSSAVVIRITFPIVIGLSLFVYLITSIISETPRFLMNQLQAEGVYQFVHSLQQQPPVIGLHVSCYHYRTDVTHRTDSNGKRTTSTTRRRVTTYNERRDFRYMSWDDVSDMFLLSVDEKQAKKSKPCLRLYLKKNWIFTDEQTVYAYRSSQDSIRNDNRWRDQYMDYYENMEISGFRDYIMTTIGDKKPKFYGIAWYMLATLFLMSVPYCWYIDSLSYEMDFTVKKRVSVLPKVQTHDNFAPVSYYQEAPVELENPNYNPNSTSLQPPQHQQHQQYQQQQPYQPHVMENTYQQQQPTPYNYPQQQQSNGYQKF